MSTSNLSLNLIEEAIGRIEKDMNKSLENDTVWDATLMRLQVIGENIEKIPLNIRKKHEEINWKKFYAYWDTISHSYNRVLIEVIMELINDLPNLKKTIKKIRGELK